jgi:hypothetical protein
MHTTIKGVVAHFEIEVMRISLIARTAERL